MTSSDYALLRAFRSLFEGTTYRHRDSSLGDFVASHLYEDLFRLGRSQKFLERVSKRDRVVNLQNKTVGKNRRRGDGTLGELVPVAVAINEDGFQVARGPIANIEIGAESKILAKAMIKQIDRVAGDLVRQTEQFRKYDKKAICVALVGVNFAEQYRSLEGEREYLTDGKKYKHPIQEAEAAISRLRDIERQFDEFFLLKFAATNMPPFPFSWADEQDTVMRYGATLTRISRLYDERF